jgi:hypothetical protein
MRAPRFGLAIALSATAALGVYATYPGNDALALVLTQTGLLLRGSDPQLNSMLTTLIASAKIGPGGEVHLDGALGDERFLEPNSGRYWQISGEGQEDFTSRSRWDRRLTVSGRKAWAEPLYYNSHQFANEPLRVVERTIHLPGSDVAWHFVVAGSATSLD